MTPPIPTSEPTVVRAGDTWKWDRSVDGYTPADGWSLKYAFHDLGSSAGTNTKLQVTASANTSNTGWNIVIAAATTAPLLSGNWKWIAFVTKAGERFVVDNGVLFVEPDLDAAAAGSQQSHAEKVLAQIKTLLEGRAVSDLESYQIAGRAVNKMPIAELLKLKATYEALVKQERNPGRFGTEHLARFVKVSA